MNLKLKIGFGWAHEAIGVDWNWWLFIYETLTSTDVGFVFAMAKVKSNKRHIECVERVRVCVFAFCAQNSVAACPESHKRNHFVDRTMENGSSRKQSKRLNSNYELGFARRFAFFFVGIFSNRLSFWEWLLIVCMWARQTVQVTSGTATI